MELALSLGDNTPKSFSVLEKKKSQKIMNKELVFCMEKKMIPPDDGEPGFFHGPRRDSSSDPPVQLDLLPFSPVHKTQPSSSKFPYTWLNERFCGDSTGLEKTDQETPSLSSSSFHMDFPIYFGRENNNNNNKREYKQINNNKNSENEGTPSRGSDEEENGLMCRKKLRLTKQQSAFLEESFKEHSTLNPKQKLALAKELNLRPRQVEVWFQNRRARTKLKQTEVDCEYLKKCCDSLTEENRKLQKELQELRALKASQPFYMQLPATTLTMCPSCERVATSGAVAAAISPATTTGTSTVVSNFTGSLSLSHEKIPNKQLLLDR